MRRMHLVTLAFCLCLAFAGCGRDEPPHLVLITIDCLRADRLAVHGGDQSVAPNLNDLARRGVVFEHAVTAAGTTFPSHASMLTGLNPRIHGVRSNRHALPGAFPLVSEALAERGYRTRAFVSFRQMVVEAWLGRGFEARSDTEDSEIFQQRGLGRPPITPRWS